MSLVGNPPGLPGPELDTTSQLFLAELRRLAAFKMPADKVHYISRVSGMIINLLSLR